MIHPASFPNNLTPSNAPDPALQAALAELLQLGLVVARVSARLAEVEGRAVEVLAKAAVSATRAVVATHGSVVEAGVAGRAADVSDTARDAIAARMVTITDSFDKAARAVRRIAALQARLADGRGFRERARDGRAAMQAGRGGAPGRAANDAERAERMDAPEWGDEIRGRSDEEVVRDICRDLGAAVPVCGVEGRGDRPAVDAGAGGLPASVRRAGPGGGLPERVGAAVVLPRPDT